MTADLIKIDAEKVGGQLSQAVAECRSRIDSVAVGLARDLVQVQSALALEESLTDEAKALILAAGDLGQYELQSSEKIPEKLVIQVCVQACMRGLSLGGMQFGVSYHRGKATLFIKSAGWLQLFSNSGRASAVQVQMGKAVIVKTGDVKKDKIQAIAWVAGKASVTWDGRVQRIDASGDYAIGVNCEIGFSDGIDSLQAKAKRRLLQMLWHQCGGACEAGLDSSTEMEQEAIEAITEQPATRDFDAEKERFVAEYKRIKEDPLKSLYLSMMKAPDENAVASVMEAAATAKMNARDRGQLELARDWQLERIAAGAM